ncbi:membrane protein [Gordonia phage Denise]|uniref:Membrane protein n=1 Tax=Gordonia phage Denise TaxID=2652879 RepID=A0A5P8DDZ8_9CAUD|nr:membrane protein [Gordonia phage Denise]QFP96642.1 membrane protein [Gordonia phage Denise]
MSGFGALTADLGSEILAPMTRALAAHYLLRVAVVLAGLGLLAMVVDVALGGALIAVGVLCLLVRLRLTIEPASSDGRCQQCRNAPATDGEFCSEDCAEDYAAHSAGW